MADPITDPKQAGERLLQFAREGRLVQHTWHTEVNGREVACLLGAAAGVRDGDECPASLMAAWVAHALPGLFDGQTKARAMTFARRWGEAMVRDEWTLIDWDAVRTEWMSFVVRQAEDAAASASIGAKEYAADATIAAAAANYVTSFAADRAAYVARVAAEAVAFSAADAANYVAAYAASTYAARDAQADALMNAIERAMEVARG